VIHSYVVIHIIIIITIILITMMMMIIIIIIIIIIGSSDASCSTNSYFKTCEKILHLAVLENLSMLHCNSCH
jgi:hypothetical protein